MAFTAGSQPDLASARNLPGACSHLGPVSQPQRLLLPRLAPKQLLPLGAGRRRVRQCTAAAAAGPWPLLQPAAQASSRLVEQFRIAAADQVGVSPLDAALQQLQQNPAVLAVLAAMAVAVWLIKRVYDTPSRVYDNNVGDEYDAWAEEGILEYYWGEHIHLGYYTAEERAAGYLKKDFKQVRLEGCGCTPLGLLGNTCGMLRLVIVSSVGVIHGAGVLV